MVCVNVFRDARLDEDSTTLKQDMKGIHGVFVFSSGTVLIEGPVVPVWTGNEETGNLSRQGPVVC